MRPQLPGRVKMLRQLLWKTQTNFERQLILRATPAHLQTRQPNALNCNRNFSQSSLLLKKKGKGDHANQAEAADQPTKVEDPFDFSTLQSGIDNALERLKKELSMLRTGGRFNPEVVENIRVHVIKGSKDTERLGDLAQVLPKGGRSLMLLVGDKEHIKPIISAIQGSKDLNLQPQLDPHNPSQLNIPIPPPTKESRDLALAAATKAGEAAYIGVRNARATTQKRLRGMETKKAIRPDDLRKAHKEMEKVVEKGNANVKQTVDAARKTMELA